MLKLIQTPQTIDSVLVINSHKITRQKRKRKIYSSVEEKRYKIVYNKRIVQWDTF